MKSESSDLNSWDTLKDRKGEIIHKKIKKTQNTQNRETSRQNKEIKHKNNIKNIRK